MARFVLLVERFPNNRKMQNPAMKPLYKIWYMRVIESFLLNIRYTPVRFNASQVLGNRTTGLGSFKYDKIVLVKARDHPKPVIQGRESAIL